MHAPGSCGQCRGANSTSWTLAGHLDDLGITPGHRLEALRADRRGQFSMRVNRRYRICFRWTSLGPDEVEIVDYHD